MQGIQFFHYRCLLENLQKLQQQAIVHLPCEHEDVITQHEERLKEIYTNYQVAIQELSLIVRQFEEHKQSIRRLTTHHKQCLKQVRKKEIPAT